MSESLDKLLECAYACDFCTLEIPSMVEYRNEQRTKKRVQNFFKKIFDVYIELVPRTTPKSWIIRKIENSDAGRATLLKYLQSTENYFITAKQYEVLLAKRYLYLCENHSCRLDDKHIAVKGSYCGSVLPQASCRFVFIRFADVAIKIPTCCPLLADAKHGCTNNIAWIAKSTSNMLRMHLAQQIHSILRKSVRIVVAVIYKI